MSRTNKTRKKALNNDALGRVGAVRVATGGADRYWGRRAAAGLCARCGQTAPIPNNKMCRSCWFKNVAVNNTGTAKNAAMLEEIWLQQGGRCAYTGEPLTPGVDASLDHKTPLLRGGTNDRENLQWVLHQVNRMKTDMTHEEFVHLCWWIGERR